MIFVFSQTPFPSGGGSGQPVTVTFDSSISFSTIYGALCIPNVGNASIVTGITFSTSNNSITYYSGGQVSWIVYGLLNN